MIGLMPCCDCKKGYEIYYANEEREFNQSCHDFCLEFKEWWEGK